MRRAAFYSAQTWVGNCPTCPPISCTPERYNMRYMLHIIIWDVRVDEGVWEFRVGWKNLIRAGRYVKYSPKYLTSFMNVPVR